jgi:regulatory protein
MKGRITLAEALNKLTRYCADRERCHSEVRSRLLKLQVYGDDLEEIISKLVENDFLNEERFARSYVRGKFRINKWGRTKIIYSLRSKKISDYCINKGLEEIDEDEYRTVLRELIEKKLKGDDSFEAKRKVVASMQSKGYEMVIILEVMKGE